QRQRELEQEAGERAAAEEKLQQQVQEMEAIYQGSPLGFALIDREMRYWRINQTLAKINGVAIEQTLGRIKQEVLGDLAAQIAPVYRQVIESGQPLELEFEGTTPKATGHQRFFWAALYPLHGSDREVRAVSCVIQDITGRKEAQRMNAQLANLVQSASEAIISASPEGVVTTWNPAAEKMFGYPETEIVGQNASLLTPPILEEEFKGLLAKVQLGETVVGFETVRRKKDGMLIDVVLNLSPLRSPERKTLGITAVIQNISERKRTERVLRESETRLNLAVDVARIGFWEWELPTSRLYASERCLEMFAVTPEQKIDYYEHWVKSLHPEDRDRIKTALADALRDQTEYDEDYRIIHPDGSVHWISARGRILAAHQERPSRMIGVLSDITRRKQAETALREAREELEQKNQELEKKVLERTAQLQEALGDLEHFAYGIAHDLRAPLRRMSQFAYLVQVQSGDSLDETSKDFLEQIIAVARRADTLINDVLAYSRLGRTDLMLEPVDLASLVRQVVQDYPALQPSAVDFETHVPTTFVLGQPAALMQCISNLISNAVKFVAPGTRPHIKIGAELKGNKTRFYVQDNGVGIEQTDLARIWKVFERVPHDGNYEGTGIGLSIVRKAIERMGGTVGVESEPGHGSTFWFELGTSEMIKASIG
ncbi:MAG: hypothetical protein JWM16_3919, partial [Verrucomicrobiales bacterium]|nr:hypothetical protein [Verrucomicrobiales bacterium]